MNFIQTLLTSLIVAIAAVFGGWFLVGTNQEPVGGVSRDDLSVQEFTQGGGVWDVVDANGGTYSVDDGELENYNVFEINAGGAGQAAITFALPATSTLTEIIPKAGDMREWIIDASALAAATTTTITAGTGIDLIAVTNADDIIDGGEYSRLTCWRKENTNIGCIVSELLNAD